MESNQEIIKKITQLQNKLSKRRGTVNVGIKKTESISSIKALSYFFFKLVRSVIFNQKKLQVVCKKLKHLVVKRTNALEN